MELKKTIIRPPSVVETGFHEIWKYRELIYIFSWRDIKVKYKQTFFGLAWALLQPLGMVLLFALVFSRAGFSKEVTTIPYIVFVLSGLILWNLFNTAVSHAAESMITNSSIIRKIYFPRLVIPLAAVSTALFDFMIALMLFFIVCLFYKSGLSFNALLFIPIAIVFCVILAIGFGLWLAALTIKYRDFRYALPFLLQLLFFGTQVLYPITILSNEPWYYLFICNPMNAAIELFRAPLLHKAPDMVLVSSGISIAIVILISGYYYFKKTELYFADLS